MAFLHEIGRKGIFMAEIPLGVRCPGCNADSWEPQAEGVIRCAYSGNTIRDPRPVVLKDATITSPSIAADTKSIASGDSPPVGAGCLAILLAVGGFGGLIYLDRLDRATSPYVADDGAYSVPSFLCTDENAPVDLWFATAEGEDDWTFRGQATYNPISGEQTIWMPYGDPSLLSPAGNEGSTGLVFQCEDGSNSSWYEGVPWPAVGQEIEVRK